MRQRGFTLVELLVVLGIIALLTSVIFAALGPSRERGRETVCASQMHQWGMAFAMYAQDYGGVEPVKGEKIMPSKLGMPFDPESVVIPYHLEHIIDCPSTHWSSNMPKRKIPQISYELNFVAPDDNDVAAVIARYGQEFPILVCFMHNANTDFHHQPTWAKKRLLLIRWDQHLDREVVPVHTEL